MFNIKKIISILILLITFVSINQWSAFPLGNTFVVWILDLCLIASIIVYKLRYFNANVVNRDEYKIVSYYFIWMLFGVFRGVFVAENYWEWKQLFSGAIILTLPIFTYIFYDSKLLQQTLNYWVKYAIPLFVIFFGWLITIDGWHFYLSPIYLFVCFFPLLNKKWKIIFGCMAVVMLVGDIGARSQVIKTGMSIVVGLGCYFHRLIPIKLFKLAFWTCYILPIILVALGVLGTFNIFEDLSSNEGKYTDVKIVNGEVVEVDASVDTRTFIYEEVISSAIEHKYIWMGRTPARGNDSKAFGSYMSETLGTGRHERHQNELCHLNIFTWLGLIGMLLYSYIYFQGSYLAVFRSNNIYMKLLGCFVAFRWAFGWIEDTTDFTILSISLWMMIAMCFSFQFRVMSNRGFAQWFKSIFK